MEIHGNLCWYLLFMIYINDLDENIKGSVSTFADNPKIGRGVDGEEVC